MQPDLTSTIAEIRYWNRKRNYTMESRKISDLRLGAELRSQIGWRKDLPASEADEIKKRAAAMMMYGEKWLAGKPAGESDEAYEGLSDIIVASIQGRLLWDALEKNATKQMERLAKQLPVWDWCEGVRGLGARSLAVIVGEAGDLSKYPEKGHLWKRMGLAVIDGVRQGGLTKGASKDDWIEHGYNRKRRSTMFVIGDVMVKVGDTYRQVYLARKEFEKGKARAMGLTVCASAKIPAKRKDEFRSDGHIHALAQRYMEKRLLRDLWQAWKRATLAEPLGADFILPVSKSIEPPSLSA